LFIALRVLIAHLRFIQVCVYYIPDNQLRQLNMLSSNVDNMPSIQVE